MKPGLQCAIIEYLYALQYNHFHTQKNSLRKMSKM